MIGLKSLFDAWAEFSVDEQCRRIKIKEFLKPQEKSNKMLLKQCFKTFVEETKNKPKKYTSPLDFGLEPLPKEIELLPSNKIFGFGSCTCEKHLGGKYLLWNKR